MNHLEAIRFSNEVVRPLCEEARAFKVRLDAMKLAWFSGMDSHFNADTGDEVEDGRQDPEAQSLLTCGDVVNAVAQLLKTATGEAGEWHSGIIQKPCVRFLP